MRLSYDKEILILRPEDDGPLADLLNKFKKEKRHEYAARKQELHMLLELLRSRQPICGRARYYAHIVSNGYEAPSPDSVSVWQYFLDQERITLDIKFGQRRLATPAEVCFDPGAYGAQPARWAAMRPQGPRPNRKT